MVWWKHARVYLFLRILWFRHRPVLVHPQEESLLNLVDNTMDVGPDEVRDLLKHTVDLVGVA